MKRNGDREEARQKMIEAELAWIARRWGFFFEDCVAYSVANGMAIGDAEYLHGVGHGLLTPLGSDEPLIPLDRIEYVGLPPPNGAHTLEELEILEGLRDDRMESLARTALAHGF